MVTAGKNPRGKRVVAEPADALRTSEPKKQKRSSAEKKISKKPK